MTRDLLVDQTNERLLRFGSSGLGLTLYELPITRLANLGADINEYCVAVCGWEADTPKTFTFLGSPVCRSRETSSLIRLACS